MRRLALWAALLALVAVGCKIETNFIATIDADGSGTVTAEVGVDEEAQNLLFEGSDPSEDIGLNDAPGATTRVEERDGLTFYIVEAPFANTAELESFMAESDDSFLTDFSVTNTGDRVTVSGTMSGEDSDFTGDLDGFSPEQLEDTFSAHVRIKMPGRVLSSNADDVLGDGTLSWDVPLFGGTVNLQAESDPNQAADTGGGFPIWLLAIIGVAVVGAILWFMNNRNADAGNVATGDTLARVGDASGTTTTVDEGGSFETTTDPPPAE